MKNKFKLIALILMIIGNVTTAKAQYDQNGSDAIEQKTPHGGTVVLADNQFMELVISIDKSSNPVFTFYLLDNSKRTLSNSGKTGVLFYQTIDKISEQNSKTNFKLELIQKTNELDLANTLREKEELTDIIRISQNTIEFYINALLDGAIGNIYVM